MTFGNDPTSIETTTAMMMRSRQAIVDYMTPLGLTHLMDTGHHYGPGPWVCDLARPEWNPCYYHKADARGIGFDRTKTGSNALAQYAPQAARQWASPKTIADDYLLWFHHVPWDHRLRSGRTVWDELVTRYTKGVEEVRAMRSQWETLEPQMDPQRFQDVAAFLRIQEKEAKWWRDASVAYFQSISGKPLPQGAPPPEHSLEHYKSLKFPHAPGH